MMKINLVFTFCILLLSWNVNGQSEEDLIRHTLQNYMFGTSYNYLDQIEYAFIPDATLYLENKEGVMLKLSPKEYISYFKGKPGEFTGRYSKILSIDREGNMALAKAEILVPKSNRRYLDVFIVKEIKKGEWKIVSKAANSRLINNEK